MAERVLRLNRCSLRRLAVAALAGLAASTVGACGDDTEPGGDVPEGECVGKSSGDATVSASHPSPLPGGGEAGIGSVDTDADPHLLNIVLGGDATQDERDSAVDLAVGDTFTLQRSTYTVVGFCEDEAWLNRSVG